MRLFLKARPPLSEARLASAARKRALGEDSLAKALEAGERWITVHPNGPDAKGQPILVQPQKDGSMKVVGGAGGSLNHLRLTGVRPAGDLADTMKQRAEERKARKKRQRDRDKALGLQQSKKEAHEKVQIQKRQVQRDFVKAVGEAVGWKPEEYTFNEEATEGVADHVANQMRNQHLKTMVKRAQEVVNLNRERLVADHAAQAQADLGEVPLDSTDPDVLSVQDVAPVSVTTSGLGFTAAYRDRAEKQGANVEEEAKAFKKELTPGQRKAATNAAETAKAVRENLEAMRDPDAVETLAPKLVDAKKALDLIKLDKKRRLAEAQAKKATKAIEESDEAPKAFVIEVDNADVDAKVAEEVENDLRTLSTRAFLSEVGKHSPDPVKDLSRYVGSGAYNSVNSLALAAGGAALVDRSVVDVLGIAGASEVLARRLASDLTHEEYQRVTDGMEEFHRHHYLEASKEAIARARELEGTAAEMELGEAEHGADLAALQEINRQRKEALAEANKVLGSALGEMEANAALVYALGRGKTNKPFEVSLGDVSVESAVAQLRAIGLERGDYSIETISGNRIVKVQPHGLDRLAQPVNREDLEQTRRNLSIIHGDEDEEGWLPEGVTDRPDLDLRPRPGAAPSMAQPFEPGEDLEQSVRDYIGGRAADGDAPADIVSDLQSLPFMQKVGDRGDVYRGIIDRLAPLHDDDGKLHQAEALRERFEGMADEFAQAKFGQSLSPIHKQTFPVDDIAMESLHRALAAHPAGVAAYKAVGEMTPQDQAALREHFAKHVAKESPEATAARAELEKLSANEPEKTIEDMFGEATTNPEWNDWSSRKAELSDQVDTGSLTWSKYVQAMRSPERAYAAIQDLVRSDVNSTFATAHNTLRPDAPLKVGRTQIRENLNHLDATDHAAREARMAKERALTDSVRERVQGRYASGSVGDKLDAAREEEAGLDAAQMGLFGAEPSEPDRDAEPLASDERTYLGHAAERQVAALMGRVGQNFRAGQATKLFRPTMSGGNNWARQRAIKMIAANKRAILSFGTGSGKTLIGLGAFTHLHSKGDVKRGLFLVPSIAQGGFHADALRFLKPGAYKWHAKPGAGREERLAAYKDPENHFAVMTHQSFRDDMVHLGAKAAGIEESAMAEKVGAMTPAERRAWVKGVMADEGISFDYLNVDEGHNLLNREGKEDSTMANVIDAVGDNSPYYVNASADPVKNDVSEAFSLLQKMDPERYTDRAAFMRKYGVNTPAAADSLRRELARFQYPSKIDPDIHADRQEIKVEVSDGQKQAFAELDANLAKARLARMTGKVDLEAIKALSPSSFEGVEEGQHEQLAADLTKNLGLLKDVATNKILTAHPDGNDMAAVSAYAGKRKGKQGVIFAHGLDAVERLRERLEKDGFRVATITGKDSAKDKAKVIDGFNPQSGEAKHDIVVCSDAGATGANLQSGKWLINYDTPQTAMTHAQRNGRINRTGQTSDVELADIIRQHPAEKRRRDRLARKYQLRELTTTPMESLDDTGVGYFLKRQEVAHESGGLF